jgi:hypothetical protein
MDKKIEQALQAALKQFSKVSGYDTSSFSDKLYNGFKEEKPFLEKAAKMDSLFDAEPQLESLREIFFDLLLINFFSSDLKKLEEDYLESKDWEDIEEKTIDRGTEILNLLLYLKECESEGIVPELNDYLTEFLLVNEDEFQDEYRIYEDVIGNQLLADSSFELIAHVAGTLTESSEIKPLFYPLMGFFYKPNPDEVTMKSYIENSKDPEFDSAVYALLTTYNRIK